MSAGAPWSVKGIDPKAREVAKDLARRSGMTLGEWLNRVILEDDLPEEVTAEAQFGERSRSFSHEPRLRTLTGQAATSDLARFALALDRLSDRIEASESRTGLAISGVEHSVRQALARIESAERGQLAVGARVDEAIAAAASGHRRNAERLERLEAGPRSAEALRMLEARIASVQPEAVTEAVLLRLGDRLASAEARTAEALSALDARVTRVERGGAGDAVEARLAEMAGHVRAAEARSTRAVDELGRQVLTMAEAVGRRLTEVDQRSADAIDQVGSEVARIAGAVEQRLARSEHAQAAAFERFSAEVARVTELLAGRQPRQEPPIPGPEATQDVSAADARAGHAAKADQEIAPPPSSPPAPPASAARHVAAAAGPAAWLRGPPGAAPLEPEPETADAQGAETAAQPGWLQAGRILAPPPEPEPEPLAAFGPELFSRSEPEPDAEALAETVDAAWRRIDLEALEAEISEGFAPIPEDDDLFETAAPARARPAEPELSTREVIDRARAAARAAQDAQAADLQARISARASGRLFGFGGKPRKQNTPLQTALMVAGGAAFLSVGAAGLTLMQGGPRERAAEQAASGQPRAAMALSAPVSAPGQPQAAARALAVAPVFAQVRAEVEAGVPGGLSRLIALAQADHPRAQFYLGQLYAAGQAGLPRDLAQARRFTALAAEGGEPEAMHNLGVDYFRGEGGPQDLTSAAQWFRKAAAAGVVESQYNLGVLYMSGSGVRQDLGEARRWFGEAAAGGDAQARSALAQLSPEAAPQASSGRR